jgi:hypothetical protein
MNLFERCYVGAMQDVSRTASSRLLRIIFDEGIHHLMSQLERALNELERAYPSFTEQSLKYATTGPETARKMARRALHDCADDTVQELDYSGGDSPALDSDAIFTVRLFWHCGAVMEEALIHEDSNSDVAHALSILNLEGDPALSEHDWYWRGLSALAITDLWIHEGSTRENADFIEFAGKHRDIGSVIDTAVLRGSLNVGLLESVLSQSTKTPALRSGTL